LSYDWPGNVRELGNVVERAVVLCSGGTIILKELPRSTTGQASKNPPDTLSYRDGVNAARKELVLNALAQTGGNRSIAARVIGLETKYFLRLMKSLAIE
jgi:DNA-binding NtrC family response regulator